MSITTRTHWRIAALCGLLALVASIISPNFIQTAEAHTGTPGTLCGSVDIPPTAVYMWQYTVGGGHHYHTWDFPPAGAPWHDEYCGVNP